MSVAIFFQLFISALRTSVTVTSFVIVIMIFIHMINIKTDGLWIKWLQKNEYLQIFISALTGLIPGCMGGFIAVGAWTHGSISFGALIAALICSIGDEVFLMFVQMPGYLFEVWSLLLVLGIVVGYLVDFFSISVRFPDGMSNHLQIHNEYHLESVSIFAGWKENYRHFSLYKSLLLIIVGLFTIYFGLNVFSSFDTDIKSQIGTSFFLDESFFQILFFGLLFMFLFSVLLMNEHFFKVHLWQNIIKKHVPKIFVWTLGTFLVVNVLLQLVDVNSWVSDNFFWMLLFIIVFEFLPETGLHYLFIALFIKHQIPFSLLMADLVMQDGHSILPMFAESKKGYFLAKSIKAIVAVIVAMFGYFI